MAEKKTEQKVVIVGAGPVGALAALYAARRGDDVHVYELRAGTYILCFCMVKDPDAALFPLVLRCSRILFPCKGQYSAIHLRFSVKRLRSLILFSAIITRYHTSSTKV
jgi:flavin-dependent dehydrogenase